jgi:NAD(P)H-quinone oxidoreductase subunit 5
MTAPARVVQIFILLALASPAVLVAMLVVGSIPRRPLSERAVARMTSGAVITTIASLAIALATYLVTGVEPQTWTARKWFATTSGALQIDLLADGWGLGFAFVAAVICGTVSVFSYRYLHRERGFVRYFILYACFVLGVQLMALAGSSEVLFAGWELLGLSSSLLIAFFHERRSPVTNAMRVFAIYRVSDAAMLVAAVLIHHLFGSGSLTVLFREGMLTTEIRSTPQLAAISFFFLLAAAGKSGLVPFTGWLPRAMEGPTPSSAVYYGALSVHAGCYLLWRAGPLIRTSLFAEILVIGAGVMTTLVAALAARVQTNVKAALSYATLTQVGVIVIEIALGFRTLAFVHLIGNACVRLVQFLTAPNVLLDLHGLEGAGAARGPQRPRLYALALQEAGLDVLLDALVVRPFLALVRLGTRLDVFLSGERPRVGPVGRETMP